MVDGCGRTIDYLRISVTDRCNLRCCYCMPEEGILPLSHEDILTYQEIIRVCRAGVYLGIRKIKLTGGEPLVRKNIEFLAQEISRLSGIRDVTMTSNGCLLKEKAEKLKRAGVSSVNVSLDTLNPSRFARITRRDCFESVLEGIKAAKEAGLRVKINCAVMEELRRDEVLKFARFSEDWGIPVRFIEMMPVGQGVNYKAMENKELEEILTEAYGSLTAVEVNQGNGPAVYYSFGNKGGMAGFISAVHHKFCHQCNRVRVTSDGYLKLCLDSLAGVDLKTPLRQGISEKDLSLLLRDWIEKKPESHHFQDKKREMGLNMNQIGG